MFIAFNLVAAFPFSRQIDAVPAQRNPLLKTIAPWTTVPGDHCPTGPAIPE
jgi:hypothetical protein